jgi:hypothetical protein
MTQILGSSEASPEAGWSWVATATRLEVLQPQERSV